MMKRYRIPERTGLATTLTDIGLGINRRHWALAAVLAAHVEIGKGQGERTDLGGRPPKSPGEKMSCREFAALGIHGLADHKTVAKYVRAWLAEGHAVPEPGELVNLPDDPFPGPAFKQPQDVFTTHVFDGDYAPNAKIVDAESAAQRSRAAMKEVVLTLDTEQQVQFRDDVNALKALWELESVRDVVLRATHECALAPV